ncbi:MAG: hypothetical protein ACHQ4H_13315 [Ktedonobacterales bacterium]
MRAGALLFTTLIRIEVAAILVLLVVLDVSRSLWIDLAGIAICAALLAVIVVLAARRRRTASPPA